MNNIPDMFAAKSDAAAPQQSYHAQLKEMGFPDDKILSALALAKGKLQTAIDILTST